MATSRPRTFTDTFQRVPAPREVAYPPIRQISAEEFARIKLEVENQDAIERMRQAAAQATAIAEAEKDPSKWKRMGGVSTPIPLYYGKSPRVSYNEMIGARKSPPLTPAQQEALDAQIDYLNEYTMEGIDESSGVHRRTMIPTELRKVLSPPIPSALQREMDALARADAERDIAAAEEAEAKRKPLPRKI